MGRSIRTGSGAARRSRANGFTYVGVLVAVAVLAIGLTAVIEVWTTTARREQLTQLNWIGAQYVDGIRSYYESTTGPVKIYPRSIEDLLEDKRGPLIRRHLRSQYRSPFGFPMEPLHHRDGRMRGVRTMARQSDGAVVELHYFYDPNCQQPISVGDQGVSAGYCSAIKPVPFRRDDGPGK